MLKTYNLLSTLNYDIMKVICLCLLSYGMYQELVDTDIIIITTMLIQPFIHAFYCMVYILGHRPRVRQIELKPHERKVVKTFDNNHIIFVIKSVHFSDLKWYYAHFSL